MQHTATLLTPAWVEVEAAGLGGLHRQVWRARTVRLAEAADGLAKGDPAIADQKDRLSLLSSGLQSLGVVRLLRLRSFSQALAQPRAIV